MHPEVLTAKVQLPHDEACRWLRTSTVFGRLPTAITSSKRDSRHSLSSELETKAVSNFCFQKLVAKNVHLVPMMRNDAPGLQVLGATLPLHQVFLSQNLAFQSQNATMRPDSSSPAVWCKPARLTAFLNCHLFDLR